MSRVMLELLVSFSRIKSGPWPGSILQFNKQSVTVNLVVATEYLGVARLPGSHVGNADTWQFSRSQHQGLTASEKAEKTVVLYRVPW
jgi:hypothetical protein